ncbi:MAG: SGNH/GDSL hydrolase family protein [Clostridia bacterium]|nr:SGNH/GDSL hydrolase family protein [Clostridia bacterium]
MRFFSKKSQRSARSSRFSAALAAATAVMLIISVPALSSCSAENDEENGTTGTDLAESETEGADSTAATEETKSDEKLSYSDITELSSDVLEEATLKSSLDAGSEYIEKFAFLCDGTIYGLKYYGMLSEGRETDRVLTGASTSLNLSCAEEIIVYVSSSDALMTAGDAVATVSPEYLLIYLGTDEAQSGSLSYSEFKTAYGALIASISEKSPSTVIIAMSLLPGSDDGNFSISDAENYNVAILAAAAENGAYYLDLSTYFTGTDGFLRDDCDAGSSRLNTTGLKYLLEYIRKYSI